MPCSNMVRRMSRALALQGRDLSLQRRDLGSVRAGVDAAQAIRNAETLAPIVGQFLEIESLANHIAQRVRQFVRLIAAQKFLGTASNNHVVAISFLRIYRFGLAISF